MFLQASWIDKIMLFWSFFELSFDAPSSFSKGKMLLQFPTLCSYYLMVHQVSLMSKTWKSWELLLKAPLTFLEKQNTSIDLSFLEFLFKALYKFSNRQNIVVSSSFLVLCLMIHQSSGKGTAMLWNFWGPSLRRFEEIKWC